MNALNKLKQLEREATPGNWEYYNYSEKRGINQLTSEAKVWNRNGSQTLSSGSHSHVDAKLITESRNSLKSLIDIVEAAKEYINEIESEVTLVDIKYYENLKQALKESGLFE